MNETYRARALARLSSESANLRATLDAMELAFAGRYPVELATAYHRVNDGLSRTLEMLDRMRAVGANRRHTLDEALGGALTRLREG